MKQSERIQRLRHQKGPRGRLTHGMGPSIRKPFELLLLLLLLYKLIVIIYKMYLNSLAPLFVYFQSISWELAFG